MQPPGKLCPSPILKNYLVLGTSIAGTPMSTAMPTLRVTHTHLRSGDVSATSCMRITLPLLGSNSGEYARNSSLPQSYQCGANVVFDVFSLPPFRSCVGGRGGCCVFYIFSSPKSQLGGRGLKSPAYR